MQLPFLFWRTTKRKPSCILSKGKSLKGTLYIRQNLNPCCLYLLKKNSA
jgi:hypothetical protein